MDARYEALIDERRRNDLYARLNPNPSDLNCPACADAVDNFLTDGIVRPVPNNTSPAWNITAQWLTHPGGRGSKHHKPETSWYRAHQLSDLLGLLAGGDECRHVVVHGRRAPTPGAAQTIAGIGRVAVHVISWKDANNRHPRVVLDHWFLILKVRDTYVATDCFGRPPYMYRTDIAAYVKEQEFDTLEAAFSYDASVPT